MLSFAILAFTLFCLGSTATPLASFNRVPLYPRQNSSNPIVKASFTWNANCGSTVACGPSAAGVHGVGAAAINTQAYENGQPIVNGVGKACGRCWHLQPLSDVYPNPKNLAVGTPIVVKINDVSALKGPNSIYLNPCFLGHA